MAESATTPAANATDAAGKKSFSKMKIGIILGVIVLLQCVLAYLYLPGASTRPRTKPRKRQPRPVALRTRKKKRIKTPRPPIPTGNAGGRLGQIQSDRVRPEFEYDAAHRLPFMRCRQRRS